LISNNLDKAEQNANKNLNKFILTASSVQVCSRNDPNIDQCITNSVNKLKPYLATGNLGDGFVVPVCQ